MFLQDLELPARPMTTATTRLNTALLTMARRAERRRCSDPVDHMLWTTENADDRAIAARWCVGCQVSDLCADAAIERDERHGVWGGRDLTRR